jgi:hypothetical protein
MQEISSFYISSLSLCFLKIFFTNKNLSRLLIKSFQTDVYVNCNKNPVVLPTSREGCPLQSVQKPVDTVRVIINIYFENYTERISKPCGRKAMFLNTAAIGICISLGFDNLLLIFT